MKREKVRLRTPAKVNPVLEVLRKREDGFHELALVFQAVSLYDEISLGKISSGVDFEIDPPLPDLAPDDSNLVVKAARLFLSEILQNQGGVRAVLTKKIPQAAGLGGGSSDAAATLWGLEALYQTGCGSAKLQELATRIGSDVSFFLEGGTALGLGRGELIEPWFPGPTWHLVLVKPPEGLSTPLVYRSGKALFSDGARARAFRETAKRGNPHEIAGSLYNGLESAAFNLLPSILRLKEELIKKGALGAMVSGSGPTVFAVVENQAAAGDLVRLFKQDGWTSLAVETVSHGAALI